RHISESPTQQHLLTKKTLMSLKKRCLACSMPCLESLLGQCLEEYQVKSTHLT
ncbi:unnamed protein product, partial [Heterosigma akashiwo]